MPPGAEGPAPTEEEMRAAYEAEIKRLRVEDVIVQTLVSPINLGARKAGIAPGTEGERDAEQLRQAIEGSRALLPIIEEALGPEAAQLRDALSQLQLAYTRLVGGDEAAPAAGTAPGAPGAPGVPPAAPGPAPASGTGPAQSPSRLWIPGQ